LEDEKRNAIDLGKVLDMLNITEKDAEGYREQEMEFQQFVTGKRMSMAVLRDVIGGALHEPQKWIDGFKSAQSVSRVQVYEDCGGGYSEENSYFLQDAYVSEQLIEFEQEISGNVKMLRIDPCMDSCMVKILEMTFNGESVPLQNRKVMIVNGKVAKAVDAETKQYVPSIVFPTTDPNINIGIGELSPKGSNKLYVKMEVVRIPMSMAVDIKKCLRSFLRKHSTAYNTTNIIVPRAM
jgi:hypothetical protein